MFVVAIFGRPFVKRFALSYRTVVCLSCPVCPVCNVGVLCPSGWVDQDETCHAGRPRPRPHCVRWGPSCPPALKRKGHSPQFSAHVRFGQMAGWIKMPLGTEVGLGPSNFVLDVDPASYPKKGTASTQCSAHIYCGQSAGWIKMPLGTEVGLSPGDVV